jgi:hypothetical protein
MEEVLNIPICKLLSLKSTGVKILKYNDIYVFIGRIIINNIYVIQSIVC